MYGIPLQRLAGSNNIQITQRLKNTILREITGAPWYLAITSYTNQDLALETVHQIASRAASKYVNRIHAHVNTEALSFWKVHQSNDSKEKL